MTKLLAGFVLALMATSAQAQGKVPLSTISKYLNGLTTVTAPFTQYNDDGSQSTGQLYLNRPGRMRFEYDPPNGATVVAGNGAVVIHDPKSNQPPESYPLKRTPLSIILDRRVNLGQANMVVGHSFDGTSTVVTAQDPKNPDYGRIDLKFSGTPLELRSWVIHDGAGGQTTVVLGVLTKGQNLGNSLFSSKGSGSRGSKR
ncbi:LolA family protein [Sedimentitalea todarodis]|uniref:Outer membrane lipoprotein carrier protein LolA n=1 Tax=Sedimentitalea todarodis TaxID=1631240 RepID=A0ABU3VFZ2_9RHOB|nr:outer membrane lipoprotein carrier protein LolA [Sedimentitalea todarodis]MDU9005108.1 outer membrane lipoprotein carrier protein LolA [Sedimentitalea todarodis]